MVIPTQGHDVRAVPHSSHSSPKYSPHKPSVRVAGPMSIAVLVLRYADIRRTFGLSPATFAEVEKPAFRQLCQFYGTVPVSEFGPALLRAIHRRALVASLTEEDIREIARFCDRRATSDRNVLVSMLSRDLSEDDPVR